MDSMCYVGSSVNRKGGFARIRDHELESNKKNGDPSVHWDYLRRDDVVSNFRIAAVWSNVSPDDTSCHDLYKWLPMFVEAMVMLYLGMYTLDQRSSRSELGHIFTKNSYDFAEGLVTGTNLAYLSSYSLNRAWPLMQGTNCKVQGKCSNQGCTNAETVGRLRFPHGPPEPGICDICMKERRRRRRRNAQYHREKAARTLEEEKAHRDPYNKRERELREKRRSERTPKEQQEYQDKENARHRSWVQHKKEGRTPEEEAEFVKKRQARRKNSDKKREEGLTK